MKKIIPIFMFGLLVISGLGAVAHNCDVEEYNSDINELQESKIIENRDYTHTVLIEVGTSTTCPSCPASNTAWHNIYESGNYDFEYTEMVVNKNPVANSRMNGDYNLYWVPTSYFDGGQFVYPGTNYNQFYNNLDVSGSRIVPDLVATLEIDTLGGGQYSVNYTVTNNEAVAYPGHLRIYVIEKESTMWNDYSGNPYYHAFLDFVSNQAINIPAGGNISDNLVWDADAAGYPSVSGNNLQFILAVFDDLPVRAWSDPFHQGSDPEWAPFWAYFVDETIADSPPFVNTPPDIPTIDGPTSGVLDISYEFIIETTDPDEHDVYYYIDWGDDTNTGWIGPYESGDEISVENSWSEIGEYDILIKAKDILDDESGWSDPHTIQITENEAPEVPSIDGPTWGIPGEQYTYEVSSTDPNGDDIIYCFDFGDDSGEVCLGPFPSGTSQSVNHIWEEKGTYIVKVKATDIHGASSDWATLEVVMPVNKVVNSFIQLILERFPNAFPMIRYLFGL